MKTLQQFITEKILISKDTKYNDYEYVDGLEPKSIERAEAAYNLLKKRYEHIFDNIKILKTNNIRLSDIKQKGTNYDGKSFTLYLNDKKYILRISYPNGNAAKLIEGVSEFNELIKSFDKKLIKHGYII